MNHKSLKSCWEAQGTSNHWASGPSHVKAERGEVFIHWSPSSIPWSLLWMGDHSPGLSTCPVLVRQASVARENPSGKELQFFWQLEFLPVYPRAWGMGKEHGEHWLHQGKNPFKRCNNGSTQLEIKACLELKAQKEVTFWGDYPKYQGLLSCRYTMMVGRTMSRTHVIL